MKFGVIVFPGSNCDDDMVYVLNTLMGYQVRKLWHKETDLQGCDFLILPGGFSYGDYLRSGAIARFSPIMQSVVRHAEQGGKVLGICNGFQILTEAGLLEGALLKNNNQKYICKNVFLAATQADRLKPYAIPIAHGDGRYYADNDTLKQLQDNEQILFQYCDAEGNINVDANPNGSLLNIAGICSKNKNVIGMMPHPERASDPYTGNTDGKTLLQKLIEI
ncbi:MAG: phosphoribosylformylglycinamidine synthase subunit PurQ [Cytophagales bacterium]|nr:MAG: phosphoribosylformylglycinamidine synthase subunit PurQ [Cytophagales bacterium]